MAHGNTDINALFKGVQRGEKHAFDQLYLQHFDNLKRFAQQYIRHGEVVEELVSELFIRMWLRRDSLHEINNPTLYLYRSVKNACLTYLKREDRHIQVPIDDVESGNLQVAVSVNPEQLLEYKELLLRLDETVDHMPDQRRMIFRMVKEDRLKCREVAELLGVSIRTVENHVYRAIKQLNEVVERYLDGDGASNGSAGRFFFLFI